MRVTRFLTVIVIALLVLPGMAPTEPAFELKTRSDVKFQPLNPLRGDASPKAGVLWGDIKKIGPTGTLIEFRDGFSSPPHIHNITYRAVVISGEVHNDDPDSETMWMGPGSFWVQPAGETHITSARGEKTTAFLEILSGPYLVQPAKEAFDNGERPINIEARNVVWLDPSDATWIQHSDATESPEMAFLWGTPKKGHRNGTFLRLPAGYSGTLSATDDWLKAVVIEGNLTHQRSDTSNSADLEPGSYFGATKEISHGVTCGAQSKCLLYVSAFGKFNFSTP